MKTYNALVRKLADDVHLAGEHVEMWKAVTARYFGIG